MLFLMISLFVLSIALSGWGMYQAYHARKHQEMNILVGQGLDDLLVAAKTEIAKNKKLVEKARSLTPGVNKLGLDPSSIETMDDPGMLATLVTVLVNKYGTIRLGISDFSAIEDDQFVSVYMDTNTQELLLSLNQDLERETAAMLDIMNFSGKDDGTYH